MIPVVVGSSPIGHPIILPRAPRRWRAPALRKATVRGAFRAVLQATFAQIEANARGVAASADPEFLHQLRVGQRRLRAALRAFRAVLDKKSAKRVRRKLRKLSPILGAARDWDVLVARLEASGAPELLARARRERDAARQAAIALIASPAFQDLIAAARALAVTRTGQTLAEFGAAALSRAQRKLLKQGSIDWHDAAGRHAVRIRVKRLRYSCEFFAAAFPARRAAPYLANLKELQEILGELNDIAVGRRLLGFDADEAALVRKLEASWRRFAKRRAFWQ